MRRLRKVFSVLLVLALCLTLLPAAAEAADEPQKIGNSNVYWSYEESSTTLIISGTGDIPDYDFDGHQYQNRPWQGDASSITAVRIEEGVTSIGAYAFFDCTSLTSVTIPASVTSIGDSAFSVQYGRNSSLTNVTFAPDSKLETIGPSAFASTRLTSVQLPSGLTSMGPSVFGYCTGLTEIEIPANVTRIGYYAFKNCSNLAEVTFLSSTAPTLTSLVDTYDQFDGCAQNLTIYHPASWESDFRSALGWPTEAKANYMSGAGTQGDPYRITSARDLADFRDVVNGGNDFAGKYIKLMNDINLADLGTGTWEPIGINDNRFTGTFDGQEHTISGLYIDTTASYQGLFGRMSGTVQNLAVSGSVTAGNFVGGVVGQNHGTVENCSFSGSVTGNSGCAGGVAGQNHGGTVRNCYNTGSVTNTANGSIVGGVVGRNERIGARPTIVTNCYYLDTCGGGGSGASKTAAQFSSGEVARLLADGQSAGTQVWGQRLTGNSPDVSPVLTNSQALSVLQVTFKVNASDTTAYDTAYTNPNGTVALPGSNPTPPDGQVFAGWQTADAAPFTETTPVTADLTVTAVFSDQEDPGTPETPVTPPASGDNGGSTGGSSGGSSESSYSPVQDVGEGGSVQVRPRTAEEGDTVTLTPAPDAGYEVEAVTVTDRNGREVVVTDNGDGTYTFEQPRGRATIEVTFREIAPALPFTDVPEDYWACDEIAWAYFNGYMNGTSATTFSPGGAISRQQVWMILARLSGVDPANMEEARQWAINNGISDGTNPGGAVTRQQLAALLFRFAQANGYDSGDRAALTGFPDAASVSAYAVEALQWATASGIINGTSDGTLNPAGTATRAQFAIMLQRFWEPAG